MPASQLQSRMLRWRTHRLHHEPADRRAANTQTGRWRPWCASNTSASCGKDNVSIDVSAVPTTVVFPAPLLSTIGRLGALLARESKAAGRPPSHTRHADSIHQPELASS
jgi:hypothetical protein